ncbi:MAG: sugar phosphate isomerase/epimerase, partial [Planctomycetes bacterium]|nr:sugar phosphate isomerase/epimerase [Planctomycetota bacterium]
MKIGVFSPLFGDLSLTEMFDRIASAGLDAVEIGCGYFPGHKHCDFERLLGSDAALREYRDEFAKRNLVISALSAHGTPLHPDKAIADESNRLWHAALDLAPKLGVDTGNAFAGGPGAQVSAQYSTWGT